MKLLVQIVLAWAVAVGVQASEKEVLACVGGVEASVDGANTEAADASPLRFLLTLHKNQGQVAAAQIKWTGAMEGFPTNLMPCGINGANNLYSCADGAEVLWYFPEKKHGLRAAVGLMRLMQDGRVNAGSIFNYSCTPF